MTQDDQNSSSDENPNDEMRPAGSYMRAIYFCLILMGILAVLKDLSIGISMMSGDEFKNLAALSGQVINFSNNVGTLLAQLGGIAYLHWLALTYWFLKKACPEEVESYPFEVVLSFFVPIICYFWPFLKLRKAFKAWIAKNEGKGKSILVWFYALWPVFIIFGFFSLMTASTEYPASLEAEDSLIDIAMFLIHGILTLILVVAAIGLQRSVEKSGIKV